MKYCSNCGSEVEEDAAFCQSCGKKVGIKNSANVAPQTQESSDTLGLVAFVFMILACIYMGFALFPLIWCIPMTVYLNGKLKSGEPIGVGFKICTLLFVSLIAGILLLCRQEKE